MQVLVRIFVVCILFCPAAVIAQESGAEVAFTVGPNDMIPEGIAYQPRTQRFFLSSFRYGTIYEVSPDGTVKQMFPPGYAGLLSTAGLKVDGHHRALWVCYGSAPHLKGYNAYTPKLTGVAKIDLESNEIVAMHSIQQKDIYHIINDIDYVEDGTCYATSFSGDMIYRVDAETAALEPWLETPKDFWPNGIAIMDRGEFMYVSGRSGLIEIYMPEKSISHVEVPEGESLIGIDGLYAMGHTLVAVQSLRGFGEQGSRIVQIYLDGPELRFVELDRNHPAYDQPTTGTINMDDFYFIANSQFTKFDQQFNLDEKNLKPVTILKVELKPFGKW